MTTKKLTKLLALYLPYILLGLVATNFGEAWRLAEGKELGGKIMPMMGTIPVAFANPLPSLYTCSLIILDVMMPDMNGFQVLQKIREKNNVPVLMLTAKSDEEDKVSGLRLGADDYLTKPFGINELMARVNSLIRRYTTLNPVTGNEAATMLLKDMVIDKINRTVTVWNLSVDLTGKEFDLLLFLASNKGRVFTKKQLYMQVWTEEYDFDDNNLMAFISKLRKKIEPNPEQPFYIQTVRGVGYRFNKEA